MHPARLNRYPCISDARVYIYCISSKKNPCSSLFDILVQPCSTPCSTIACSTLFDPLFDPLFDILVRSLFDNLVRNRLFLYEHPFLHPCSTLVRPLVRPLVQRPCSTLFDRLFDVLVQSRPGPAKSEHSVAEVPCSIACSSGIVLQRYFVHRLFGFFLDRIFIR